MKVYGRDSIEQNLAQESFFFKGLLNNSELALFPARAGSQEVHHNTHFAGKLFYRDNQGNALAIIFKPGWIQIRKHEEFSTERVRLLVGELKELPELKFAVDFKVTYGREVIDPGVDRSVSADKMQISFEYASIVLPSIDHEVAGSELGHCMDRTKVLHLDSRLVLLGADGAGESNRSGTAADTVINVLGKSAHSVEEPQAWATLLKQADFSIVEAESTGIVVDIGEASVIGASVGDSEAWVLFSETQTLNITKGQHTKPLLGSKHARPKTFQLGKLNWPLLVASDGFTKYLKQADRNRIYSIAMNPDIYTALQNLIDLVRLPSGGLQDDVFVSLVRPAVEIPKRQVYHL